MILIDISYLIAAILFIIGIKRLTKIKTAKYGNFIAAVGMFIAVVATLWDMQLNKTGIGWVYIIAGLVIGSFIGIIMAKKVPMTAMPETVAVLNGFGGGASVLVTLAYFLPKVFVNAFGLFDLITVVLSIIIGTVTFTGSMTAYLKLQGHIPSRPILFLGNNFLNLMLFLGILGLGAQIIFIGSNSTTGIITSIVLISASSILGILLVTPIGGADMPVVISLLNAYSGLAAGSTGFVLKNNVLIVSGALVGASGVILTKIMCKAMNRSLANVLFGGFGQIQEETKSSGYKNIKEISSEEAALILESAQTVLFVPGYGMAVAQAQYAVQELAELLEKRNIKVSFAIHPVAGRMPGHMNVLLAEANVPYDKLYDLEQINHEFKNTDVAIVIGANDVVNPAANTNKNSPIYGMPILNVYEARNVIVIKRSLNPGFAGMENELFDYENTRMLFGDAKKVLQELIQEVEEL